MEIRPVNNLSFKNYTSDDLYRLEQKLDTLQTSLKQDDLNSFYKSLPKRPSLPMPLGVPPYQMGMPPMGPMGIPGMYPGMYPGMMPPPGGMYGMPMPRPGSMPPPGAPVPGLYGQPPRDSFCPKP